MIPFLFVILCDLEIFRQPIASRTAPLCAQVDVTGAPSQHVARTIGKSVSSSRHVCLL